MTLKFGAALATEMARLLPIYNQPIEISIKSTFYYNKITRLQRNAFIKALSQPGLELNQMVWISPDNPDNPISELLVQ